MKVFAKTSFQQQVSFTHFWCCLCNTKNLYYILATITMFFFLKYSLKNYSFVFIKDKQFFQKAKFCEILSDFILSYFLGHLKLQFCGTLDYIYTLKTFIKKTFLKQEHRFVALYLLQLFWHQHEICMFLNTNFDIQYLKLCIHEGN